MEIFSHTLLATILKTIFPLLVLMGALGFSSRTFKNTHATSSVVFCLACVTLFAVISRSFFSFITFLDVGDVLTLTSIAFALFGCYLLGEWIWLNRPLNFIVLSILSLFGLQILTIIHYQNHYNWDDYSHWLPLARHLYNTGDFVSADNYPLNVAMPSYPPALAIMVSIFHSPFSSFNEKVPIFVTNFSIALMCFTIFEKLQRANGEYDILNRVGAICVSLLAMSWLFTWHQYSSYADVPLAIFICILMLRLSELRLDTKFINQPSQILAIIGCLILIPLIKNYGIYLSLSLLFGWLLVSIDWLKIKTKNDVLKHIKVTVVFGAVAILSHNLWVVTYEAGGLVTNSRIQPLANWKWDHWLNIFSLMAMEIWTTRYIFYIALLLLPLLFPIKLFLSDSIDSRAVKITLLFILSNFFLTYLFYLAILSDDEVNRMLSFERYLMPSFLMSLAAIIIWLYNNLPSKIFTYLQRLRFVSIIVVLAILQFGSISKILSPSTRVDHVEYTKLLEAAIGLTKTQSIGFFYNIDSKLNLPRLIYNLPVGYTGSWKLKHDLQRLNDTVYNYETYNAWLGNRKPDVLCFTGKLIMPGTKYMELNNLSIQHPLKCLTSKQLASVLGLI